MALAFKPSRDFGLSSNLTLPVIALQNDLVQGGFMPEENSKKGKGKKHARFAIDQHQESGDKEPEIKSTKTWGHRLKGIFRRNKKKKSPYIVSIPSTMNARDDTTMAAGDNTSPPEPIRRSESNPEITVVTAEIENQSSAGKEHHGSVATRKQGNTKDSDRMAKAKSTAFEQLHINTSQALSEVHLTLKPKSPSNASLHKVILHHHEGDSEGFGLHLSGGLPPITVTYVKPGGEAGEAGVRVGDIILDVNGLNCRKKVEIAKLMELKMMVQQTSRKESMGKEHINEAAWSKIKAKQDELDSEDSGGEVTKLDSSSEEEEESTKQLPKVTPQNKAVVKHETSGQKSIGPLDEPLATSSPIKDKSEKTKKKKKKSSPPISGKESKEERKKSDVDLGKPLAASSPIVEQSEESKSKPKKKKKKNPSLEEEEVKSSSKKKNSSKESGSKKKNGRKSAEALAATTTTEGRSESPVTKKKKKKKTKGEKVETPLAEDLKNKELQLVSEKKTGSSGTTRQAQDSLHHKAPNEDEVDGSTRNDRSKRSSSPKSRYQTESPADPEVPGVVTVGVIKKERDSNPKSKGSDKKKASKKEKGTKKKEKSKRRVGTTEPPPVEELSPSSAAISGSIESDTLTFVSPKKKGSKSSLKKQKTAEDLTKSKSTESSPTTKKRSTLPRRKSEDHGKVLTSYSSMQDENMKAFREELREASKSQYDIPDGGSLDHDVKIEIDSNIKVKKSGQVKEGKSTPRPSIFEQSSSPEPEEASISSGAALEGILNDTLETNLLETDFKVKKSGVVVEKKSSTSSRPSIFEEPQKSPDAFADNEPGEMKYHQKVSMEMDISAIPQITPSLGLVAGRDRLDTINRSLTKRRPPNRQSLRLDSKEEMKMGTERVDLSKDGKEVFDGMANGGQPSTSRTAAARKLFESNTIQVQDTQKPVSAGKYNDRFSKAVEQPIKKLGTGTTNDSQKKTPTEPAGTKPSESASRVRAQTTVSTRNNEKENSGAPSWVAIAQGRQKRSNVIEKKEPKIAAVNSGVKNEPSTLTTAKTKDNSVPEMGHVAMRMAMFQKN